MKFFIPYAADDLMAEEVYTTLKKDYGQPDINRRIFKIYFQHNGKTHTAQVGEPDPGNGGLVLAIFQMHDHYRIVRAIFTDKGPTRETSYSMVGEHHAMSVTDFESP